jgi:dephospho-CoA kinase
MKIVGVSGKDRSGKDTVAELLIDHGWFGFSFGDAVRRHARKRHQGQKDPISVKNLTETSNWLRSEYGADVILNEAILEYEKALARGEMYKGLVAYSVRAPIEADFILQRKGELIWVDAADEVRYQRKIENRREGESLIDMKEMLEQESLQAVPQPGIPEDVQMNLQYVQSRATKVIENNDSDLSVFHTEIQKILSHIL